MLLVHSCLLAEGLALVEDPQGLLGQHCLVASAPDVALGQPLEHPDALDAYSRFQQLADEPCDGYVSR
ncbi:MAG TPA: hypothetical protein VN969_06065 [Streptosporangiaceae bacterium]|nr:hypothetical protein [Streptosporangiaceae bacterium]